MRKIILIEGMHCASCASNIERSVRKVAGVSDVTISLMTRKGFVTVADTVRDDDLKAAVKKAGYKAVSIENE